MAKKKDTAWALDPNEVGWASSGSTSGRRKHATKSSRATSITGATLTLCHYPTGIQVAGEIARGHYTRTKMNEQKRRLYEELFPKLEALVAKHLGIPGR